MAIKVVKHGLDNFVPFECTCGACGAILEITELDDMKTATFGGARDESGDMKLYVICPDCEGNVICPEKVQGMYLRKVLSVKKGR